jgi:uncharacterized protein (UPF0276 family)
VKLAVNYSKEALALRESGAIPIDLLKCALFEEWIDVAQRSGPIYVHFPLGTTPNGVVNFDHPQLHLDWILALLESTESAYLNLHIKILPEHAQGRDSVDDLLQFCVGCIEELAHSVDASRIIIENTVARADYSSSYAMMTLGPFFSRLVQETGCGLLLDSAHLSISCAELGLDFREEVMKFPLHELGEWHICGTGIKPGRDVLFDSMAMRDEDWEITAFVAALIRSGRARLPEIVAIEYGGIGDKFEWRSESDEIHKECVAVRQMLDLIR